MKCNEMIPDSINALVLHGVNDLRYQKVDNYILKKDYVLVKIKCCGICSSDIERVFFTGTYHFPTIPGHEMSGQIVGVNDEDEELLGRKTCIFPLIPCMKCEACEKEEYAQCSNYNYFGSRCDGGFAEYLLVPKWNLVLFDDSLNYEVAALCEPAVVSLNAVNVADIKMGDNIAVSGTGTIAIIIALLARNIGANVCVVGRSDESLEFIRELGIETMKSDFIKDSDKTDCSKFTHVFEVVGSNESINQSVKLANSFATIVMVGNPKADVIFEKNVYWKILRKKLTIKGIWNSNYNTKVNDWHNILNLMTKGDVPFEKLISKVYSLDEFKEAFAYLMDKNVRKVKVMFKNE